VDENLDVVERFARVRRTRTPREDRARHSAGSGGPLRPALQAVVV